MSRRRPDAFEQAELLVPCSRCRANVGHWCRSRPSGGFATYLHGARYWAVQPYIGPILAQWDEYLRAARIEAWAWRQAAIRLGHAEDLTEEESTWPPRRRSPT